VQVPVYAEGFAFADGRAVVTLSVLTLVHRFPTANEQFLERQLVGRAEANEAEL
jgi:hypothetical protein